METSNTAESFELQTESDSDSHYVITSAFIIPKQHLLFVPEIGSYGSSILRQISQLVSGLRHQRSDQSMAGEMGSFKRRITRSMTAGERAAKAAVAAGDGCALKRCQQGPMEKRALKPRATKRKAEEAPAAGGESQRRKRLGRSELDQGAEVEKKMTRLPQEEIDYILGRVTDDSRAPRDYKALKRQNPGLIPSPEEETNQRLVGVYAGARVFYAIGERFSDFQAWVRSEYTKNGYVEVDDEFLANRAEMQALNEEARNEALAGFDFSEMDDDMKRVFLRF